MKFGLVANLKRVGAAETVHGCIGWANRAGHEMLLMEDLREVVEGKNSVFLPEDELARKVDMMVSMGGDGTLLATARAVGDAGTPILGINLGSLGFLTQQTPQQLVPALEAIVAGHYQLDERMLLHAEVDGTEKLPSSFALNDVVINNGPVSRLLDISLDVDGERVVTYKSDGLVVATPTGSTAYNLAVGGPIMHPSMDAIIVAPISPFSLTTRPMIFRPDDRLEFQILSEEREASLTLDGQIMITLQSMERVCLSRASFRSRFVVFPEGSYYHLLKTKLNWGVHPNFRS
ncbi:NAD(+)/NADH kinase [bacterium]|nr:NAD(+)/NADH kinase [bacterium]MCB2202150.1 NAD(+)/NADH kinase [bacterium]